MSSISQSATVQHEWIIIDSVQPAPPVLPINSDDSNSQLAIHKKLQIVSEQINQLSREVAKLNMGVNMSQGLQEIIHEDQMKIAHDIKVLKFDQEAIIKSMIQDGKAIVREGEGPLKALFPHIYDKEYVSKRHLNWLLRRGQAVPFIAEHTHETND